MQNIIGFLGIDTHDIILYLAQILVTGKRKVLVIDNSADQALHVGINYPESLSAYVAAMSYNGFDFLASCPFDELSGLEMYTDVLVNFGFKLNDKDLVRCNHLYLVTDMQKHNIYRLRAHNLPDHVNTVSSTEAIKKTLVIRNQLKCNINMEYILEMLKSLKIAKQDIVIIPRNDADFISMLYAQYDASYSFTGISKELKELLIKATMTDCNFTKSEVAKIYKKAARGD